MRLASEKVLWADALRVFATFAVILLHVAAPILYEFGRCSANVWWTANIYDGCVRFCVPIFIMLSGALMLGKSYTLKDFYKKRFTRILIPFLIWTFIYSVHEYYVDNMQQTSMTAYGICKFFYLQLRDGASFHLWFVYMIMGLYFIFPIINKWVLHSTDKEVLYFLLIWFFLLFFALPFAKKILPSTLDLSYFKGYLGYFVLGYWLNSKPSKNKIKILGLVLMAIGSSITILGTYWMSNHDGQFNQVFYEYLSPNVLITSIGVFLFFKSLNYQNASLNSLFIFISKYSYGIYLAHLFVLFYLSKVGLTYQFIHPLFAIPITSIICMVISLVLTLLINKLPFGKLISG